MSSRERFIDEVGALTLAELQTMCANLKEKMMELELRCALLEKKNKELEQSSLRDALTGILNRGSFNESINKMFLGLQRGKRDERRRGGMERLSLLLVDIDKFKAVNDTYGHVVGDQLLKHIAGFLVDRSREQDLVCRYGGDEFAIILPNDDLDGSNRVRQNMLDMFPVFLKILEEGDFRDYPLRSLGVGISVGAACTSEVGLQSSDQLIATADQRMYMSKPSTKIIPIRS